MILKLGMQNRELRLFKADIDDDQWFTLTYFMAWLKLVARTFEWETQLQSNSMGENLQQMSKLTKDLYF